MPRYDVLPGIGRVRVYDAGPRFADRYTVLFEDMDVYTGEETTPHKPKPYGIRQGLAIGDNHGPNGFCQWIESPPPLTYGKGADHRRIPFASLAEDVQAKIIRQAAEIDPATR